MKKKLIALFTAMLVALTAFACLPLAGCKKNSNGLRILLLANNDEDAFYRKYFADLAEEYGIEIKYDGFEEAPYLDRLNSEINQGNIPDIFYVRPNDMLVYAELGLIQSLEDYSKSQTAVNLDDVYESALNKYRYNESTHSLDEANGKLYAFPKDLSTQQLGYNKTIVNNYKTQIEAAGLQVPWEKQGNYTWEEFRKMCETIVTAARSEGNTEIVGCDVPDFEILMKSFGGSILNGNNVDIQSQAAQKALQLQADLLTPSAGSQYAAADYRLATYGNFSAGKVAFYGACGSWEVKSYNTTLGEDGWDVMPWPKADDSSNWYGKITSAGFVVSASCKNAETAMEIAASFMTNKVQENLVRNEKLTLPITKSLASSYVLSDYDDMYSPKTRSVFIDVISGEHGFFPAEYSTRNTTWKDLFDTEIEQMWLAESPSAYLSGMNLSDLQSRMQQRLNSNS